jgi:hypothetical protein
MSLIGAMFVVQVILPGAAQARCDGPDNEITSHLRGIDGVVYVTEVPVTGTCNENHYYQANYKSEFDGWRASVWLYNNNGWVGRFGKYNTAWYYYQFNDGGSPTPGSAAIHLCLDNGSTWYCGWGYDYSVGNAVDHSIYGTNHGF